MTTTYLYNVIWLDDDLSIFNPLKVDLLKNKGIHILAHAATGLEFAQLVEIHKGKEFFDVIFTSYELSKAGVDVTLICDNMASIVMKNGWIDAVVVGCDRMAANGDGANKIGTSGVAILAKEYGIPFYMYVPTSTIDLNTKTGKDIPIELREGDEIYKMWYEKLSNIILIIS